MSKFIPVEWLIKRNDMYVNIDCFEDKGQGKIYFKPICCRKVIDGCDITTCGCDPKFGMRIQVFDKYNKILAESEFLDEVNRILIDNDSLGQILIKTS